MIVEANTKPLWCPNCNAKDKRIAELQKAIEILQSQSTGEIIDIYSKDGFRLNSPKMKKKRKELKEARREGICTCLTCEHVAEMKKLIPDDILRNEVLAVTNELYESMASESMDLSMEVIAKDKRIKELEEQLQTPTEYCYKEETVKDYKDQIIKLQGEIARLETKSQYWFNRFNELEKDDMPNGEDVF